ncbi:tetratricopeptide repeat protein, partial [archaeon]|nr:tetratricopeptide repeat protein [archaeon]
FIIPIISFSLAIIFKTNINFIIVFVVLLILFILVFKNIFLIRFNLFLKEKILFLISLIIFILFFINYSGPFLGYWDTYIASPSIILTGEKTNFIDINNKIIYEYELEQKIPNDLINKNTYGIISKDQRIGAGIIFSIPFLFFGLFGFRLYYSLFITFSFILFYFIIKKLTNSTIISYLSSIILFLNEYFFSINTLNPNILGLIITIMIIYLIINKSNNWFIIGIIFGIFGNIRNVAILFSPALGFILLNQKKPIKKISYFLIGVITIMLPLLYWNYFAFGNPILHSSQYPHFEGLRPEFSHKFLGNSFNFNGLLNFPFHLKIIRTPHYAYPVFIYLFLLFIKILGLFSIFVILGFIKYFKKNNKNWIFYCLWLIPYITFLSFQENWEIAKTSFILLILPIIIIFMSFGLKNINFKSNKKQILIIFIILNLIIIGISKANYTIDERWYQRFPKASENAFYEYDNINSYQDEFKFFQSRETLEELEIQKKILTKIPFLPYLKLSILKIKPTIKFFNEIRKKNISVLVIWKYIYVQNNSKKIEQSEFFFNKGQITEKNNNISASISNYEKSIEFNPKSKKSYERLIELLFIHKSIYDNEILKYLNLYLQNFPNEEVGYTLKSLIQIKMMNLDDASNSINKSLEIANGNPLGLTHLANGELSFFLEHNMKKYNTNFRKSFKSFNDLNNTNFKYLASNAFKITIISKFLVKNMEFENAFNFLTEINTSPQNFNLLNLTKEDYLVIKESEKWLYLEQEYIENSEKEFFTMIRKFNESNKKALGCAYQALGVFYYKNEKYQLSVENYKKAADASPTIDHMNFKAAHACFMSNLYDCSLEYINKAIAIENEKKYSELKGFIFLMTNKINKAKEIFKEISVNNKSTIGKLGLGHIHLIEKDYINSEKIFNEILNYSILKIDKNDPTEFNYLYTMTPLGLGWTYANQNQHKKALKYYNLILEKKPNHLLALISKGNSFTWLQKYENATNIFNKVLKLYPENEFALAELGLVNYNQGNYEEAEKKFKKALEKNNNSYTCPYEGLGLIYYKQGKTNEAKNNLQKSIDINPNIEFEKFNALAKIFIEEGNLKKAIILLEKSIENFPYENNDAYNLLNQIQDN